MEKEKKILEKEDFLKKFEEKIKESKNIVITSHQGPDDDSIGSVLSTHFYIKDYLKKEEVQIVYFSEKKERWKNFEGYEKIVFTDDIQPYIEKADLLIIVDVSSYKRINKKEIKNPPYTIVIDHHKTKEDNFQLEYIEYKTSTAEIIYDLFYKKIVEEKKILEKKIVETLLLGILGDTGNLRYVDYTQKEILKKVYELIEVGKINIDELESKYQKNSLESLKLSGELLKNLEVYEINDWPKFVVTHITRDYVKEYNIKQNVLTEASAEIKQYLKQIWNVHWGFILTPRTDYSTSISFRSTPKGINVRLLAEKLMIGGGHDLAAGATIKNPSVEESKNIILDYIKKNSGREFLLKQN